MSFANLTNWRNIFMTKSEPKDPQSLPFLVLGNKCDIDDGLKKVSQHEAKQYCDENNLLFFETSAKDNQNIEEAFKEMVVKVLARQDNINNKILGDASTGAKDQGSAVAGNANRRMTRRTNTKVVLDEKEKEGGAGSAKKSCCKN